MPSNHNILCHPLLLLPSVFPESRSFQMSQFFCIRWLKHWSFSFNISPCNECPGLISFRMDWSDLFTIQGTLKSISPIPQFKSVKSLALSFLYGPTLTSIALTRWTFVCKVLPLLFNMLSRLVIAFLPRLFPIWPPFLVPYLSSF